MCRRSFGAAGAVTLAATVAVGSAALAGRPPAAIDAERRVLDGEIEILRRRTDGLSRSLDERRVQTRRRLRTLYKMSQGGYLRLLAGAETPTDFFIRRDGVRRVVRRDLGEVQALHEELQQLGADQARLKEREKRALELALAPTGDGQGGFPARPGALYRPVAGPVVAGYGPTRDPQGGFELTSDGIELRSQPGEKVRAIAAGVIRAVQPMPGLGECVVIDHGGGFVSLTARLALPQVSPGAYVSAGAVLADAAGPSVQLQVEQAGTWVDPGSWLSKSEPVAPPVETPSLGYSPVPAAPPAAVVGGDTGGGMPSLGVAPAPPIVLTPGEGSQAEPPSGEPAPSP